MRDDLFTVNFTIAQAIVQTFCTLVLLREIQSVLQVSLGFISACNQRYQASGVEGLRLNYWGTKGYLSSEQKQELFEFLGQKDHWTLEEVINHIEDQYEVVYQSLESYYTLLKQAKLSWKKAQPTHPDKDDKQVEEKKRNYGVPAQVARPNRQWTDAGDVCGRMPFAVG
ncbi:winged helix-turn-helix domain-containing protein [Kovacikia minuta CCNUW1]|uniref:helix-turn-helix domain-containing protein n=1 Tax=Kovacikia minuta TaxID=2931930 RepID=UPI001CCD6520|nr:winged helix-turn-helix domain-containing protein [Kovacikia minuta]UBF27065.1 winged helix-turn-helix domain-containing protein [Kovacikia minuta CCNUW1]